MEERLFIRIRQPEAHRDDSNNEEGDDLLQLILSESS